MDRTSLLLVAALTSAQLACTGTSVPTFSEGSLCGDGGIVDAVQTGSTAVDDPRVETLCVRTSDCGAGTTSLFVRGGCHLELEGGTVDGKVVPGTVCTRRFRSTSGGNVDETLVSDGGTFKQVDAGVFELFAYFERRTKAEGGTQSVGNSRWTVTLYATEAVAEPHPELCGQRGGFPVEDHSALAGCSSSDVVDLRADSANRTITFGGAVGNDYEPRCVHIKAGQSVTFEGPFSTYVLSPGIKDTSGAGSQPNPIVYRPIGTSGSFEFPDPGDFLFHCSNQPTFDMKGMVRVSP